MTVCPVCQWQNRPNARFCANCRNLLPTRTCPACGETNRISAKHCRGCGGLLLRICAQCGGENRIQANRCRHCGAHLVVRCPHCQTENQASAKYCKICAANLRLAGAPQQRFNTGSLGGQRLLNGRYRVIRKIAQGGMGAVYEVSDSHQSDRVLALKEMTTANFPADEIQETIEGFRREAQLLQKLDHPNLIKVFDQFGAAGTEYLIMDYVNGETLDTKISMSTLAEIETLSIALQMCNVLEYLHTQSPPIIYRDLKPSNIMLEQGTGLVKLIDFGIVRFHKPGKSKDTALLGTPGFAPPEQYGTVNVQTDARSDIFSLGVTLFVLLTNFDVAQNPWKYPPVRSLNPVISGRLEQAVAKATQSKMDQRYQSVAEFRTALMRCKGAKEISSNLPLPGKGAPANKGLPGITPAASSGPSLPKTSVGISKSWPQAAWPSSTLTVTPPSVDLKTSRGKSVEEQIVATSASCDLTTVRIQSSAPWIQLNQTQLAKDQVNLNITVDVSEISLPKERRVPPPLLRRAWDWAEDAGASRKPWDDLDTLGKTLFLGLPALFLGGLAQVAVWLLYRHADYFVPGSAVEQETITIFHKGGSEAIPVRIEATPALLQTLGGWIASGAVVIAEFGTVLWALYALML